jgi:hypothetical protein
MITRVKIFLNELNRTIYLKLLYIVVFMISKITTIKYLEHIYFMNTYISYIRKQSYDE